MQTTDNITNTNCASSLCTDILNVFMHVQIIILTEKTKLERLRGDSISR